MASDPTVSRLIKALADDADKAIKAISSARQQARATVWGVAGVHAPDHGATAEQPLIIDLDASLVTAHSEKQQAAPTFKRGYGFHPLLAFADHGADGTGEALEILLRPGNAGSNKASDHIAVTKAALAQLPDRNPRPGRRVLVRADGAGGTKEFTKWLTGRRVAYSVGFTLPMDTAELYHQIPEWVWLPALNADGEARDGADLAELTGLLDLTGWPDGMRVIVRRERPHPGAQLRFDDVDGYRLTAFATNTRGGKLQDLELRHRRRARCEDRIRIAKDTGLSNLPLHGFDQNRIWIQIVALASELQAWTGMLALTEREARRWEPKRFRYRLFTIPATIARRARRVILHLSERSAWAGLVLEAISRLPDDQRAIARVLLEGLVLKHEARRREQAQ